MEFVERLLLGGAGALASYLAAHVLLCLIPAFFIAGAMTALIPKSSITRWLGRSARKRVSYPAAVVAGSLIAVCSCTVVPLFAGIVRKGAGIGPAITFLFFAPAGNIMALSYTGTLLGPEYAIARFSLCLVFGVGIGLIMSRLFGADDAVPAAGAATFQSDDGRLDPHALGVFLSLVFLLLAGTVKMPWLGHPILELHLPIPHAEDWQRLLAEWLPFDSKRGEEGVSLQGSLLIVMLTALAVIARLGMENVTEGANRWTWAALALVSGTLILATTIMTPHGNSLGVQVTARAVLVALAVGLAAFFAVRLQPARFLEWQWETWRFMKQIFPLLLVGVFIVGVARQLLRPEWIGAVAGDNDLLSNLAAVFFGVFMYFPTLVEVPVARMFLDLGMHPGPLLAYLMADPELSFQSILMVGGIIGRKKVAVYVLCVAVFSVLAGLIFGFVMDRWLV